MNKLSVRPTTFMIAAVNLTVLMIFSSCTMSNSSLSDVEKIKSVRQIFPSAIDITELQINQEARNSGLPGNAEVSEIKGVSGLLGYCVESKIVSRSGPFRIRVLVDPQVYVKQASVISYPWDRGRDVRKRAFTSQFEGKGPNDPIQVGKDIDSMTGATISSRVMAEGVRDTIKLIELVKEKQTFSRSLSGRAF
ncbi:MAG: FMN-binding protein [Planctomycetes bacterium]|nr:FMN-binding protein [Planctomycetota bacterium]